MESVAGRWKTFVGMSMNFAWPIGRFVYKKYYSYYYNNAAVYLLFKPV